MRSCRAFLHSTLPLVVLLGDAAPGSPRRPMPSCPTPPAPLRVLYESPAASLPLLVALERGHLAVRGVAVALRRLAPRAVPALGGSDWDVCVGVALEDLPDSADLFQHVRFFQSQHMTASGDPIHALVIRQGAAICCIDDLRGKLLILPTVFPGLPAALEQHGISWGGRAPGDATILLDPSSARLGQGSATYTWGEDARRLLAEKPGSYRILDKNLEAKYVTDPYYLSVCLVRTRLVETRREAIRSFIDALDAGIADIRSQPDSARSLIPKYFPSYTATEAQRVPLPEYDDSRAMPAFDQMRRIRWRDVPELEKYYLGRRLPVSWRES